MITHSSEGFSVATASDGARALALLVAGLRPEAVILDVRMPRLRGDALVRRMRKTAELHETPAVLLSASADFGVEGCERVTCLRKPAEPEMLIATVNQLTDRQAATKSA